MRILAVDDDPIILDLLPVILRQADLPQVTLASSPSSALELLDEVDTQFDCLLLDIMMEEMNGIELCQRIRKLPQYRHTPILMLTAVKDHSEIEAAFAAGANDYITKPFDVKEIATRVRVAQRMSETTTHIPRLTTFGSDTEARTGEHRFDIADPVTLEKSARLILPFSLGNYLSQLSRSRLNSCVIFAAKIENIHSLYSNCKSHEFATALSEVVKAVAKSVDCPKMLMSYEGNGTFLCVLQGTEAPLWPEIEDDIQAILSEGHAQYDTGKPITLHISVGNPVVPNASRNQRVKKTFDRAIGRALMREKSKEKVSGNISKRIPRRRPIRTL
ncbi:MAG: response regulator [Sulfitobacter sp.]|nr:response regulator [Sulfitobacter sp.]